MLRSTQQHPLPDSTPGVKLPIRSCEGMGFGSRQSQQADHLSLPSWMRAASMSVAQPPCSDSTRELPPCSRIARELLSKASV